MHKITKSDIKYFFIIMGVIVGFAFLKTKLAVSCENTNSPLLILLDASTNVFEVMLVLMMAVLVGVSIYMKYGISSDDDKLSMKKPIIVVLVLFILMKLLPMSRQFGYVKVNDKTPSAFRYEYYLLADGITHDTETVTVNAHDFELNNRSYTVHGGRGRSGHTYKVTYASFEGHSIYLYRNYMWDYLNICKEYDIDLTVEHYKRSGIIRTINGIDLYDAEGFSSAANAIATAEQEKKAAEEAARQKEEDDQLELFKLFYESEGKDYDYIIQKLQRKGIENTYDVVYISTHYYDVGDVAFFDNIGNTVYVVRDDEGEDMVEIPPLPLDGTLTEITEILDEHGIKWTYDCFGSYGLKEKDLDHSNDKLNTIHCSIGTPVPKDYTFWFSVRHAEYIAP